MHKFAISFTVLAAAGLLATVATAGPPDGAGKKLERHGASVAKGADYKRSTAGNGRVTATETAKVTLDGLGAKDVSGVIDDDPVASGGMQKATVSADGASTGFTYTPATNTIEISGGGSSASVTRNADSSYSVDGKAAADGAAAVALLAGAKAWTSANPHAVALAYSYAQHPNMAAKGVLEVNPSRPPPPPPPPPGGKGCK
jgi:hypothetical protein